ncbi:PerC family transcriptional regulator [Escherichia coli]|uniref:PerC family transcriptional regulator n=1 Tax=Escherichia coli TaxID=562 RepID=UPI0038B27E01
MVSDDIAERLEQAVLWRRASARWLEVFGRSDLSEQQRMWLLRKRAFCKSQLQVVSTTKQQQINHHIATE